jgi:hypothetical protein
VSRDINDPRAVEVLATFDAIAADPLRVGDDSLIPLFLERAIGFMWTGEGWPDESLRNVLAAYLINAPDDDLDGMLDEARRYAEWLEEFRLEQEYEHTVGGSCYGDEFQDWKRARLAATSAEVR